MLRQIYTLLTVYAAGEVKRRVRAITVRGMAGGIGAVLVVIAFCFFLVAAHLWLSDVINPIASAAIIGALLLLLALILFVVASRPMGGRGSDRPLEEAVDDLRRSVSRLSEALGTDRPSLRNPVVVGAAMALVIGFLLGRRGGRRERE